jgi:hypothetical protein
MRAGFVQASPRALIVLVAGLSRWQIGLLVEYLDACCDLHTNHAAYCSIAMQRVGADKFFNILGRCSEAYRMRHTSSSMDLMPSFKKANAGLMLHACKESSKHCRMCGHGRQISMPA